ncbi:MAG: methyltransferase domain-containing protein [Phycisphaera sp.]|nr:methyltransferase domain-containing protein [Phycisphaera sp.]
MSMTEAVTKPMYDIWSLFYDWTFGACVTRRQARAIEQLNMRLKPGDRVLDMGVGTGLMLRLYPKDITLVGMDLSEGMLNKADTRRRDAGYTHVELVRGDATKPPFAPRSFDHVVMCHTISVVSDPVRVLRWAAELVKDDGSVMLLNHFRSTNPVMGFLESATNPFFSRVGWKSDLELEPLIRQSPLHVEYIFKLSPLDLWKVVTLSKNPARRRSSTDDSSPNQTMPHHGKASPA